MRTPLLPRALPVLSLLLILGSGHYAAGLNLNDTTSGKSEPSSGDHNASGLAVSAVSEMPSGSELSTGDYDYSEEYDNEPQIPIPGYVIDDLVRVEQVIKPKKNKTEEAKTSDKPKRKRKGGKSGKGRRNKKKKKNPCDAEFQDFCIHGECRHMENIKTVTCNCHQDYFGERCGEKYMKTHSGNDRDLSKIALVVITVFVSVVILAVIGIVVTIQLRKRYFKEYEGEAEERKKLRQETGNVHAIA